MRQKLCVTEPAEFAFERVAFWNISDGRGGDGRAQFNGRMDEPAVEAKHLAAIGAGPLRKKQDRNWLREALADQRGHGVGARQARAIEKERAAHARSFAKEGPANHL